VRRLAATLLALCALAAGCSEGSEGSAPTTSAAGSETSTTVTTTTTPDPPAPEVFTGELEEFYRVPDPLPQGAPGELIRVQDLGADAAGRTSTRVMYHSRDATGADRAVTGVVTRPAGAAPDGGWPVVSWAHGTTGLGTQCAPSRNGAPAPDPGIDAVNVATDYVGLGPLGEVHPYLSGPSEGNSVIDAVRAATNLPTADAGTRWFSVGHSQGGHAALFAGERSEDYGDGLELLGTVSLAPASELASTYGPLDEVVARVVGVMALYGAAAEHPEIDVQDYVGAEVAAAAEVFATGCLDEIVPAFAGIPAERFYAADPLRTEPARSIMLGENDPGDRAVAAPLLLISGTADERVHIDRVRDLYARECAAGQVTELRVVDGATHGSVVPATTAEVADWLRERLDGREPGDGCSTDPPD